MDQAERRRFLIDALLDERHERGFPVPDGAADQKRLLRSLMNVRMPAPAGEEFLAVQDEYLQEAIREKGVTRLSELTPADGDLYVWQGDITTLECDAIVNAANSGMTGCYQPCHSCIDNCIHTYAGVQLRQMCAQIIKAQGHNEYTGAAKLTPAFNLPCKYVLHTVGPIVVGRVNDKYRKQLASCYRSCLTLAESNGCESVAFCCISTGVYHFPQREAADIAVQTVRDWKAQTGSGMKIVFNVFKDEDLKIYQDILK